MNQARLKEVLYYSPESGLFRWIAPTSNRVKAGWLAGLVRKNGYVSINVDGRRYYAHRLAWLYMTGAWPPAQIDHIDRNPVNNAFRNLRLATPSENMQNTSKRRDNTSGYKGVTYRKDSGKWHAQIRVKGENMGLGSYTSKIKAAQAYAIAASVYHLYV